MRRVTLPALVPAVLVALAASACAPDAPTGSDATARAARVGARVVRPISGRCENRFEIIPVDVADVGGTPTLLRARTPITGTCQVAHLGRSGVFIDQLVDFTVSPVTLVGPVVYTAANGDRLHASQVGVITTFDAAGNVTFTATHTIVGGTGRFADARGTLTLRGGASQGTLTSFYTLEGDVSY